jgi:hypothetical protein
LGYGSGRRKQGREGGQTKRSGSKLMTARCGGCLARAVEGGAPHGGIAPAARAGARWVRAQHRGSRARRGSSAQERKERVGEEDVDR